MMQCIDRGKQKKGVIKMTESPKCGCGRSPTGKKSIKKRKLLMKHVRLKNLENEYLLGDCAMATAQQML
jgi:hypothetical protein